MGISGHILGERKLRRLNRQTGMNFDRAYRYHGPTYARLFDENGDCQHYAVSEEGLVEKITSPSHWTSCRYGPDAEKKAAEVWSAF